MDSTATTDLYSPWTVDVAGLALYGLLVAVFLAAILFLSAWMGEKKGGSEKGRAYECGVIPTRSARLHHPVPFYLVAIFFLIFDVEGAFIFSWAIAFETLGWRGWLQMTFFIAVLLLGLLYIWRKGGLEWGPSSRKP